MYTEKKKAHRKIMADKVQELCRKYGFPSERTNEDKYDAYRPRMISLGVETLNGLFLSFDFDGQSRQPDIYVLPWHFRKISNLGLSENFGVWAGGDVNRCHRQKCTAIQYGFEHLMESLEMCFKMIRNGTAFVTRTETERAACTQNA